MTYTKKQIILVGLGAFIIGLIIAGSAGMHGRNDFRNGPGRGGAMMHRMPDGTMMNGATTMNMNGMMMGMVANMKGKTGRDLEKAFLTDMIPHHQGAVEMAKLLVADPTVSAELRAFAQGIITAQEGEIEKMNMWVKGY